MKTNLFSNKIEPACKYCENGKATRDTQMILCKKNGPVTPDFYCKSFQYAPLKRVPKKQAELPKYSKEDFKL